MSALNILRAQARALLPGDCFLRRDQQLRALFVTDFPRRNPDLAEKARLCLEENGFAVMQENALWLLDLNRPAQLRFIRSLPKPCLPAASAESLPLISLCRRLLAQGHIPAEMQSWDALRLVLLRLDARELPQLINELSALCAVCKRKKTPLPTAAVSLLLYSD